MVREILQKQFYHIELQESAVKTLKKAYWARGDCPWSPLGNLTIRETRKSQLCNLHVFGQGGFIRDLGKSRQRRLRGDIQKTASHLKEVVWTSEKNCFKQIYNHADIYPWRGTHRVVMKRLVINHVSVPGYLLNLAVRILWYGWMSAQRLLQYFRAWCLMHDVRCLFFQSTKL